MGKLIRNVFSNWAGLALNMATAFFMSPFLVRSLGDTWYGMWVLIRSTTGYMGLVDGGLRVSIVKYVAKMDAVNDTTELNRTVSTATAIYSGLTLIVLIGTVILSGAFDSIFHVAPEVVPTGRIVVLITGASVALALVFAVFGGFVAGMQRYDLSNVIGIASLAIRTIAIVVLIWMGYGIIALGLVHLGMQLLTGSYLTRMAFKLRPDLEVKPKHVNAASGKTLYSYSGFIIVNVLSDMLLFRTGELLAGMYLGPVAVTYYAIPGTLTEYLQKLIITMTMVLHPYSSAKEAVGDGDALRRAIVAGTKMCLLVGLPVTFLIVILGEPFIAAWMGDRYAAVGGPLIIVMVVARLGWVAQSGLGQILLGIGRHKELTALNLAAGVLSFLGGLALVRNGLFWMVVGSAIAPTIIHGFVMPVFASRVVGVSLGRYLREGILRPLVGTLPFGLLMFFIVRMYPPHSLVGVAAVAVVSAPALLLGAYFLSFTDVERRKYLALLTRPRAVTAA